MGYTIDIDTGGTFTDGFVVNGTQARTVKVPTTPHDLTVCFLECISAGAKAFGVSTEDFLFDMEIIRFSNTIGTNTIIERNGAKIGLLVSKGMESLAPTISEENTTRGTRYAVWLIGGDRQKRHRGQRAGGTGSVASGAVINRPWRAWFGGFLC